MKGYTDIHSHILPALDDGAKTPEITRQMLLQAYQEGIETIIATPHFYAARKSASVETIRKTITELEEKMKEWEIPIRLYEGNEIYYRSEVAELLEKGEICTLAGSRYVLVEFEPGVEYSYLRNGVVKLASYGYLPVVAHVERYECLFEKKERLGRIKEHGGYLQVNASSFRGSLFSEMTKRARYVVKNDLLDFVATDAHGMGSRKPEMAEAAAYLYKKLGAEGAEKILYKNPTAILHREEL